ncbi:MAG: PIN domain nuclease [Thermodesulfovibrionales bacterium]|nr:PIN domain nuclease [Thermodesulfovibrionales bacterium]
MIDKNFLIDTSVWIKCFREEESSLKEKIAAIVSENRGYTTEIIIMEILRGAKSDKEYSMLYQDFLALPQLTINGYVWETAWKTAYKLRKSGINAPMADVIISSIALHHKCKLMHSDKHFNLIAKHTEIKVVEV